MRYKIRWCGYVSLKYKHQKGIAIKKPAFHLLFSGLLPLFILAHFGHHIVGALLRPMLPMIRTDLGLSYTKIGVLASAFAITSGISQLPSGWLADRFGVRLMVVLGVSGVATAGLLLSFSPSYTVLLIFIVLAALLGGGYHPASAVAISTSVSPKYRGQALGLHVIGGSSCFWIVPLLAAPIAVAWGWRSAYIALSIPIIILGAVLYILLRRRTQIMANKHQVAKSEAAVEKARIAWRKLLPFFILSVGTGMIIQSVGAYLSLYAVDRVGVSEATAATLMSVTPAVGLFVAPLAGYFSDRIGGVRVMLAVSVLTMPIIYLLGAMPTVPALVTVMIIFGIASYTRMPVSEAYIIEHTPENRHSTLLGIYFFATALASGLLTPLIGVLIDRFDFHFSFTIASVTLAFILVVCSVFLWVNRK